MIADRRKRVRAIKTVSNVSGRNLANAEVTAIVGPAPAPDLSKLARPQLPIPRQRKSPARQQRPLRRPRRHKPASPGATATGTTAPVAMALDLRVHDATIATSGDLAATVTTAKIAAVRRIVRVPNCAQVRSVVKVASIPIHRLRRCLRSKLSSKSRPRSGAPHERLR